MVFCHVPGHLSDAAFRHFHIARETEINKSSFSSPSSLRFAKHRYTSRLLTDTFRIEIQWLSGGLAFTARDTVDIARSLVLCSKCSGCREVFMSCAGNCCGYQEVLCSLLEIAVDIRRSYVMCWT
jgi:hypothetical protein